MLWRNNIKRLRFLVVGYGCPKMDITARPGEFGVVILHDFVNGLWLIHVCIASIHILSNWRRKESI